MLTKFRLRPTARIYRRPDGDGAATGAPAAAPAAASPAPAATPPATPAPPPTALGAAAPVAAPTPPAPAAPAPAPEFKFAEKMLVLKDGQPDYEATARNAEQARQHLERRLGSGDAPPTAATEYKLTVPEALADKVKAEDLGKDPGFAEFTSKLHAAGLNQKQFDAVVGEFLVRGDAMRNSHAVLDAAECTSTLKQVDGWKTDREYTEQINRAGAALKAYGGADSEAMLKTYGNDPRFIQMLAGIGRELAEDTQAIAAAQQVASASLDTLMSSPAYLNAHDPKHASIVAQVTELQKRVSGDRPVVGGKSMSFQT